MNRQKEGLSTIAAYIVGLTIVITLLTLILGGLLK